jgi:hypothetical protein
MDVVLVAVSSTCLAFPAVSVVDNNLELRLLLKIHSVYTVLNKICLQKPASSTRLVLGNFIHRKKNVAA